jgi:hypothetical protein
MRVERESAVACATQIRNASKNDSCKGNKLRANNKSQKASYCVNSAGRPVNRSILFAIGGCVENKLAKFTPTSGWIINKCAVDGVAAMGNRRE